jgi:hypothetical protein
VDPKLFGLGGVKPTEYDHFPTSPLHDEASDDQLLQMK